MKHTRRIMSLTLTLIFVLAFGSLIASADFEEYGNSEIIYSDANITVYATEFDVATRPMPMYLIDLEQGTAEPTKEYIFQCDPDEGTIFRLEIGNLDSTNDMKLEVECELPYQSDPMRILEYIAPGKGKIYRVEDNNGNGLDIECVTVISAFDADTVEYEYFAQQTTP